MSSKNTRHCLTCGKSIRKAGASFCSVCITAGQKSITRENTCNDCGAIYNINTNAVVTNATAYPSRLDGILSCAICFQKNLSKNKPGPVRHCIECTQPIDKLDACRVMDWATLKSNNIDTVCNRCHNYSTHNTTSTPLKKYFKRNNQTSNDPTIPPLQRTISVQPFMWTPPAPVNNGCSDNCGESGNSSEEDDIIKLIMEKVLGVNKINIVELPNLEPATKRMTDSDGNPIDKSNWEFEWVGEITSIKDLIRLGKEYQPDVQKVSNLDLERLVRLVEPLEKLDSMIGLADIKDSIFQQIVFHLQGLDNGNKDMHHTVIKGPPGVGKTEIAHRLAEIYKGLGFLKSDKVVSVKRDDLIAGYVGQTAMKTKKKLEEALGGVLLIDEAYSLGDGSDKDSFSKEAVDLITSYLSEHGTEFICVIAGYKEALEKRFFSINEGLARRFTIHYEIKSYEPADLQKIFIKMVTDGNWRVTDADIPAEFFSLNKSAFPNFAGDMLNLFAYTKKAHSKRLLTIRTRDELDSAKRQLTAEDITAGFALFKANNGYKDEKAEAAESLARVAHMYN